MFNPKDHLIDLKGKQYLQVMWRLVWFREEKPLWNIETHLEQLTENHAVFSAKICDENGIQKASGYGSESVKDFRDFIEKAETKAIGRALAMLGYGTQFAPELDEENRIVDSPVKPALPSCERCKKPIASKRFGGRTYGPEEIVMNAKKKYGSALCWSCMEELKGEQNAQQNHSDGSSDQRP